MIQVHKATRRKEGRESSRALILAVVLLLFALLYPYLDAAGLCGEAGCPHFMPSQAASAELPSATLAVVAAVAAPAIGPVFGRRPASERRPAQVYATPDPEPPRPRSRG